MKNTRKFAMLLMAGVLSTAFGCRAVPHHHPGHPESVPPIGGDMPRELSKVVLPTYRIEPPDILIVEAINIVPRPPYRVRTSDALSIQVQGALPDAPIGGPYQVEPGGVINLGIPYGSVKVAGLTTDEVQAAMLAHLQEQLQEPQVSVALLNMAGSQQIAGEHLVGPDGTVTLGSYGSVNVVGQTIAEAKVLIERHLGQTLENPEVSVNVFAYNSKAYYVVTQGAGLGDGVTKFPVTGNETVLDAISNINGLTEVSSKRIWIARPSPDSHDVQILPVDWNAITGLATTATNYQIMPGDRVFIAEDKLVATDTKLAKFFAPLERVMGFSILGASTATRFSGRVLGGGGDQRRGGF